MLFYPIVISFACIVAAVVLTFFFLNELPARVPLFYSLPRTDERLAEKTTLFLLPLASFVVLLFNTAWSVYFSRRNYVLSRILSFASLLVSLLSLYTLARIIFLIT